MRSINPFSGKLLAVAALLVLNIGNAPATAAPMGKLSGGVKYQIPGWFKDSFLDVTEDASEAAEADKHLMLFMHLDECPYCEAVLRESITGSSYTPWLRKRFDVVAINVRGAREIAYSETLQVTERQLAEALQVRQTPAIIFFDATSKPVVRVNGYRTATDFKRILDFVDSKSYLRTDLASFVRSRPPGKTYRFREHSMLEDHADLSLLTKPLVVLFEESTCTACDLLHDTLLADEQVRGMLRELHFLRLDAASTRAIVTPDGRPSSPRAWARELGLDVRPAFVFFAAGKEQLKIEGVLRRFHFQTAIRFLAEGHFNDYATYREYSRSHREALLKAGVNVDLGRQ